MSSDENKAIASRFVQVRGAQGSAVLIESFYGDTIPALQDKFGSWRQSESWT
jgi:hypothetical protein